MVYRAVVGLQRSRRGRLISLCPLPLWGCARVQTLHEQVILYNVTVALLLNAVGQYLEHQAQPAVHGLQMRPNNDGRQHISLQTFLHQSTQFELLLSQQLKPQMSGLLHPESNR